MEGAFSDLDFFTRQEVWMDGKMKRLALERAKKALTAAQLSLRDGRYVQTLLTPQGASASTTPRKEREREREEHQGTPGTTYGSSNGGSLPPLGLTSSMARRMIDSISIHGSVPAVMQTVRDPSPVRDQRSSAGLVRSTSHSALSQQQQAVHGSWPVRRGRDPAQAQAAQVAGTPHPPSAAMMPTPRAAPPASITLPKKSRRSTSAPPSPQARPHQQQPQPPHQQQQRRGRARKGSSGAKRRSRDLPPDPAALSSGKALVAKRAVSGGGMLTDSPKRETMVVPEADKQFVQALGARFGKGKGEVIEIKQAIAQALRDPSTDAAIKTVDEAGFASLLREHFGLEDATTARRLYASLPRDRATGLADIRFFLKELAFVGEAIGSDERKQTLFEIFDFDGDGMLMEDDVRSLFEGLVKDGTMDASGRDGLIEVLAAMFRGIDRYATRRISFHQFAQAYVENAFLSSQLERYYAETEVDSHPASTQRLWLEACHEQELMNQERAVIAARNADYLKRLGFSFSRTSTERQGVFVVEPNAGIFGTDVFPRSCETRGVHFRVGRHPRTAEQVLLYVFFDRSRFSEVEAATFWNLHGKKFLEKGYFDRLDHGTRNPNAGGTGGVMKEESDTSIDSSVVSDEND